MAGRRRREGGEDMRGEMEGQVSITDGGGGMCPRGEEAIGIWYKGGEPGAPGNKDLQAAS